MHVSPDRFDLSPTTTRRLSDFREYFWFNSEICNECFAQIRHIGDEITVTTALHRHRINAYYERSEHAVAERAGGGVPTERYATTFCRECGAESGTRWSDTRPLRALEGPAKRIAVYTIDETPLAIDCGRFGRELQALKTGPDARDRQGRDLQCLAVAWSRAVSADDPGDAGARPPYRDRAGSAFD